MAMYRDQYGEFVSGYRGLTGGRGVMAHNVQWGAGGGGTIKLFKQKKPIMSK